MLEKQREKIMKKRSKGISGELLRQCNLARLIRFSRVEESPVVVRPRARTLAEAEEVRACPPELSAPDSGRVVFLAGGSYVAGRA